LVGLIVRLIFDNDVESSIAAATGVVISREVDDWCAYLADRRHDRVLDPPLLGVLVV
jgi:hypothetical protein